MPIDSLYWERCCGLRLNGFLLCALETKRDRRKAFTEYATLKIIPTGTKDISCWFVYEIKERRYKNSFLAQNMWREGANICDESIHNVKEAHTAWELRAALFIFRRLLN